MKQGFYQTCAARRLATLPHLANHAVRDLPHSSREISDAPVRPIRRPSGIVVWGLSGRMPRKPPRSMKDRGGVPRNGDGGGNPSREAAGAGCRASVLVTFAAIGKSDSPGEK